MCMNLVFDFLKNKINLLKDDLVVVGVSAGPDSMFLLYVLMELRKEIGFKIIVAHINHNVRYESVEEEQFLKQYCLENKVEFSSIKIEKYNQENFHSYARNIRYEFYRELIKKYKANYLMTAHHGDDLTETILMRLVRGSNLTGYKGISFITEMDDYKVVRPLLYMTKDEIELLDKKLNIPYRIDKSNTSDKYTRNRYRKKVLPFLKEENHNMHLKFLKFSCLLEEVDKFLNKEVNKIYNKVYINGSLDIDLFNFQDIVIKRKIVEKILKEKYLNLTFIEDKHVDSIIEIIRKNKNGTSIDLPNNIKCFVNYGKLDFINLKKINNYFLELQDNLVIPNGMKFIELKGEENGNDTLHLDSSMVKLPLYVRNKKDGDYIELKGIDGKKKVSDIFIDCKIDKISRLSYPVVVDSNNKIIWIPKLKKSKYDGKNKEKCDIIIKCL